MKGNLTEDEKDGLRRLQKRIKEKQVVILKTDKSGKMCLVTREEYEKMGLEHTRKDQEIDRRGIMEKEKQLNSHVFFWSKMWGSGDSHNQRGRIIDSKVVSSEQLADLYLMFKDHKEGKKTRPVVTGCNSNTRGFSNCVSDLLESVNKANENPYETNSSEDMLARVNKYNKKAEEIMKEGKDKLCKKVMCGECKGMEQAARCNKLWERKVRESGTGTGGGVEVPPVGDLIQENGEQHHIHGNGGQPHHHHHQQPNDHPGDQGDGCTKR